ncbi:MAG TPA: DUF2591 family protein [Rhodocyclaceae bacterium]|nr:DUF2591 family protein [Rhodocyclaceae bacterium]
MKIKTSELTGAALDWAVAKCENWGRISVFHGDITQVMVSNKKDSCHWFNPSGNWGQGGPIIEREKINLAFGGRWWASYDHPEHVVWERAAACGDTPLIAAMRCYVAAKLGNEVDIPEELLK